jgi:hypothetical protein
MSTKISLFLFFLSSSLLIGFWMAVEATVDDFKNFGFQELPDFFCCYLG